MSTPEVIEICPKIFQHLAKCEQFRIIGRHFKCWILFGYVEWKILRIELKCTSDGGQPVYWPVPPRDRIQINRDGTMITFETTSSCPTPPRGTGTLTVTVENNGYHGRNKQDFQIEFV
jgi:hypothetical protein